MQARLRGEPHQFAIGLLIAHDVLQGCNSAEGSVGRISGGYFICRIERDAHEGAHLRLAEFEALEGCIRCRRTATDKKKPNHEENCSGEIELTRRPHRRRKIHLGRRKRQRTTALRALGDFRRSSGQNHPHSNLAAQCKKKAGPWAGFQFGNCAHSYAFAIGSVGGSLSMSWLPGFGGCSARKAPNSSFEQSL